MPLQQKAKVENRGLVRNRTPQAQTRTAPQRFNFMQIIFPPRVTAMVKELQAMRPYHHPQWVGRPTLAVARVERGNLGLQLVPRDQGIHARQKLLAVCGLFLLVIFQFGKSGFRVHELFLSQLQAIYLIIWCIHSRDLSRPSLWRWHHPPRLCGGVRELLAMVSKSPRTGLFPKADFALNLERRSCTWPAGHTHTSSNLRKRGA